MDTDLMFQERLAGIENVDKTVWQGKSYLYSEAEQETEGAAGTAKATAVPVSSAAQAQEAERTARIQTALAVGAWIWFGGVVLSAGYGIKTAYWFRRFLRKAVYLEGNIYEAEGIDTPFVFGVVRPRIYLPAGLKKDECRYALEHERIHVARKDYLVKLLSWCAVCIHRNLVLCMDL